MGRWEQAACPGPCGSEMVIDEQVWVTGELGPSFHVSLQPVLTLPVNLVLQWS